MANRLMERARATTKPAAQASSAHARSTARRTVEVDEAPRIEYNTTSLLMPVANIRLNPIFGRERFDDEEQAELNESVRMHGIIEPLLVRQWESQLHTEITHELVAGYRRINAALHNGLAVVPVVERVLDDVQAATLSLTENAQRKDPNPVELGKQLVNLQTLMETQLERHLKTIRQYDPKRAPYRMKDADFEQMIKSFREETPAWVREIIEYATEMRRHPTVRWADIGKQIGLAEGTMRKYVRIAKLPADVQESIAKGEIGYRNAVAISGIKDATEVRRVAATIKRKGLSSRQTQATVREVRGRGVVRPTIPAQVAAAPAESMGRAISELAETAKRVPGYDFKSVEQANDVKQFKGLIVTAKENIAQIERALADATR